MIGQKLDFVTCHCYRVVQLRQQTILAEEVPIEILHNHVLQTLQENALAAPTLFNLSKKLGLPVNTDFSNFLTLNQ